MLMHKFFIFGIQSVKAHRLIMLNQFIFWQCIDINRQNPDRGPNIPHKGQNELCKNR